MHCLGAVSLQVFRWRTHARVWRETLGKKIVLVDIGWLKVSIAFTIPIYVAKMLCFYNEINY
jgi:hypothetical protein